LIEKIHYGGWHAGPSKWKKWPELTSLMTSPTKKQDS